MFDFNYAFTQPKVVGQIKSTPEDFIVEEQHAYSLSGEGEHLWLWVEKTGLNSDWVAKQIAQFIGIAPKAIGVAGKKDKFAVTRQWMSCHLPGQADPDFSQMKLEGIQVLRAVRHSRKLQTGGLSANRFELTVRKLEGDLTDLEARLELVRQQGFPNYFGEQRFGRDFNNLKQASRFFSGETRPKRHQKTMYLSAARSWIFNEVLSLRINQKSWNQYIEGDVLQLEGSQKWFPDDNNDSTEARVTAMDLHPTGALIGRGELPTQGQARSVEKSVISQHPIWQEGLEKAGLKQDRRALRVLPKDFSWQWLSENELVLAFSLPAGSFATMLVRELINLIDQPTATPDKE